MCVYVCDAVHLKVLSLIPKKYFLGTFLLDFFFPTQGLTVYEITLYSGVDQQVSEFLNSETCDHERIGSLLLDAPQEGSVCYSAHRFT